MKPIITALILALLTTSCNDSFLDKKPNKSIVVPSTLEDLQALLDNAQVMNVVPALNLNGTDDLFTTDAGYNFLILSVERNSYTWAKDFYQGETICSDWNTPYQQVFYANVVLEGLSSVAVTTSNEQQWNQIKGSALFFRAHAFYQLAQLFAVPYTTNTTALGIPIRLTADVNASIARASLQETYHQIVNDLNQAKDLLPTSSPHKTRPTKTACSALLARTYLTMEDYTKAEQHADEALQQNPFLLDYNSLNATATRPIPQMNDEILFYANLVTYRFTTSTFTYIDTLLFASYDNNDLRQKIFFRNRAANRYTFKGNYTGNAIPFGGIANDEMYLTRAECRARNGNVQGALEDLNTLLQNRWTTGTFSPITETDPDLLLSIILTERHKELIFRGTRWTDLRRLNNDPRFAKTLQRNILGTTYTLVPGDAKYTLPIPDQEIHTSGIQQNAR